MAYLCAFENTLLIQNQKYITTKVEEFLNEFDEGEGVICYFFKKEKDVHYVNIGIGINTICLKTLLINNGLVAAVDTGILIFFQSNIVMKSIHKNLFSYSF